MSGWTEDSSKNDEVQTFLCQYWWKFRGREGGVRGCLQWFDKKWQAKSDMGLRSSENRE